MRKKGSGGYQKQADNPWDSVIVKNGKLVGMLTDELINGLMPRNQDLKSSKKSALTPVRVRVEGHRTPMRSSPR